MSAIYNEIEPFAVEWMRSLERAWHIEAGVVETRSIRDLKPEDVQGRRFHAFAGIGGWSHALRLAGVADGDPRVWTGSCPCQPFSTAGKRRGLADERHLWPEWFRLIDACRPSLVFGEQVASPDGLAWFDAVSADLEGAGYACRAVDLCAAGVGAPHIRQRLYFVAYSIGAGLPGLRRDVARGREPGREQEEAARPVGARGVAGGVADIGSEGRSEVCSHAGGSGSGGSAEGVDERSLHCCAFMPGGVADRDEAGLEQQRAARVRGGVASGNDADGRGATRGFWSDADWLPCRDGKARPVEPGTFPLAHGLLNRLGRLRGYGNAIVPQVAAAFVTAALDALEGT